MLLAAVLLSTLGTVALIVFAGVSSYWGPLIYGGLGAVLAFLIGGCLHLADTLRARLGPRKSRRADTSLRRTTGRSRPGPVG